MSNDQLSACLTAVGQVFGSEVNPEQSFYDLGGDSLHAIELVMRVHELADLEVNAFDMVNAESLAGFFRGCAGSQ